MRVLNNPGEKGSGSRGGVDNKRGLVRRLGILESLS